MIRLPEEFRRGWNEAGWGLYVVLALLPFALAAAFFVEVGKGNVPPRIVNKVRAFFCPFYLAKKREQDHGTAKEKG